MGSGSIASLFRVLEGAVIVGFKTITGVGLMIVGRDLLSRSFTPDEYGLFSFALAATSILTMGAMLGLPNGVPGQIAYHGSDDSESSLTPESIVTWGLFETVVAGIIIGTVLYLFAKSLARLFGLTEYALAFRVAAVSLPGLTTIRACTAVFRGLSRTKE